MDSSRFKKMRRTSLIVLVILLIVGTIQVIAGKSGAVTSQVDAAGSLLGVIGIYGDTVFIHLEDIDDVELLDSIDFGQMIEGKDNGKIMSGTYKNSEYGEYTLHVYQKLKSFIVVHYDGGKVLVFNQSSDSNTKKIYEDILNNMPS